MLKDKFTEFKTMDLNSFVMYLRLLYIEMYLLFMIVKIQIIICKKETT